MQLNNHKQVPQILTVYCEVHAEWYKRTSVQVEILNAGINYGVTQQTTIKLA